MVMKDAFGARLMTNGAAETNVAEANEGGPDMNGAGGDESADPTQTPEDDDVVDADFEEVKN